MTAGLAPFHLAIPVTDLEACREFYCGVLGCGTGREASRWLDLDFFGHQVTLHLVDAGDAAPPTNDVDAEDVPARHFGVVLPPDDWTALRDRLVARDTVFDIGPTVRFRGEIGEQSTMFLRDPSGNALEFKSFRDPGQLFRRA